MLPVLKATSCANWDHQTLWRIIGAEVAMSYRTKPYPVNSAGVICGLTNQRRAGGPRVLNISKCVILTLVGEVF